MPGSGDADPRVRYRALEAAGGILYWLGDYRAAFGVYDESLGVARALGDRALEAQALYNRAFTGEGDDPFQLMQTEGREAAEEALAIWRELGDRAGVAQALWALGNADQFSGNLDPAEQEYLEALAIFRELGNRYYVAWSTSELGWIALRRSDWVMATRFLAESLEAFAAADDVSAGPLLLGSLAWTAYNLGEVVPAFRLAGASARLEREHGVGLAEVARLFSDIPNVRDMLEKHPEGPAEFAAGEAMDFRQGVAYALEWARDVTAAASGATSTGTASA